MVKRTKTEWELIEMRLKGRQQNLEALANCQEYIGYEMGPHEKRKLRYERKKAFLEKHKESK